MAFFEGFNMAMESGRQAEIDRQAKKESEMRLEVTRQTLAQMKQEAEFEANKQQVASKHGLTGLADFLETTKPDEALKLRTAMHAYQSSVKQENAEQAARIYGGLMQVPNEDRPRLYELMKDKLKQFDPGAPDQFDPNRAVIGIGLATPADKLYNFEKKAAVMAGAMGDLIQTKQVLLNSGYSKDSLEVKGVDGKLEEAASAGAKAQAEAMGIKILDTKDKMDAESSMRKEFSASPQFKEYQQVSASYSKIQDSLKAETPAGDLAAVFSFMKMLDPGSTVREGEYATAKNATNVPSWMQNLYNEAINSKTGLKPSIRADFSARANDFYQTQKKQFEGLASETRRVAKAAGLNDEQIIIDPSKDLFKKDKVEEFDIDSWLQKAMQANPNANPEELKAWKLQKLQGNKQ